MALYHMAAWLTTPESAGLMRRPYYMANISPPVYVSLAFLAVNVVVLRLVLALNRRDRPRPMCPQVTDAPLPASRSLDAKDILDWEFDYAKTTATQAMQDRHTMINFYLVAVGIVASGVITVLGKDSRFARLTGTALLWLLCGIGWLYFLKLIRLRQAWHESVRTMNQIKEFYFEHVEKFSPEVLRTAFLWQSHTLPSPDRPWTVFFYSAMLIALLDSVAYVASGVLLCLDCTRGWPALVVLWLGIAGLVFFAFHVWLYFAFLKARSPISATPSAGTQEK
jgi:hypothetical protein